VPFLIHHHLCDYCHESFAITPQNTHINSKAGGPLRVPDKAFVEVRVNMATEANINITSASLRGSPSDRIIKPRPRKDSLQSISGSDTHPGRITKPRARKSPGSGAKRSEPAKRKFICSFSHYGCDVALSSKNEWKRHVSIQHLQLGFYRCDVGSCNPDSNPNIPGHKRVYNDFNRKDLFTQHHRRMHKPESAFIPQGENGKDWRAFEDSLEDVRSRCWQERRKPPQRSTCGFCGRVFEGEGSWNDRMEHVGGHFSRDVIDAKEEREDEDLTNWSVQQNIIKDAGNGRYVLCDQPPSATERPYIARERDVQMTDAPTTPTTMQGHPYQMNGDSSINNGHSVNGSMMDSIKEDEALVDTLAPELRQADAARRASMANLYSPPLATDGVTRAPSAPAYTQIYDGNGVSAAESSPLPALAAAAAAAQLLSSETRSIAPNPVGRPYNVAPPPLQAQSRSAPGSKAGENSSGDRLEDLINQLVRPKPPTEQRRLTWKCVCRSL